MNDLSNAVGQFLSTPSARRATKSSTNHLRLMRFLSTPSARRATSTRGSCRRSMLNFYPRPPRGGRRDHRPDLRLRRAISIHALREEGDQGAGHRRRLFRISIHALREEGDLSRIGTLLGGETFLSTPSARRATSRHHHQPPARENFYPRPPRGGRRFCFWMLEHRIQFLSTPSARRATYKYAKIYDVWEFLSTPSARRATGNTVRVFSKHRFLSTPSARRATMAIYKCRLCGKISIHALREEGDCTARISTMPGRYFYPRPPRGGRRLDCCMSAV